MQILAVSGSRVRLATVFDNVISKEKHSVLSVEESDLMGIDIHCRVLSLSIVTSPEVDV